MEINGRAIGFKRTVKGNCDIADLCPDGDINKFGDLLQSGYATSQKAAAQFVVIMSRGYEYAKAFENLDYKPRPLTEDEVMYMDDTTFADLFQEAIAAFGADAHTTVEAQEPKGAKKKPEGTESA